MDSILIQLNIVKHLWKVTGHLGDDRMYCNCQNTLLTFSCKITGFSQIVKMSYFTLCTFKDLKKSFKILLLEVLKSTNLNWSWVFPASVITFRSSLKCRELWSILGLKIFTLSLSKVLKSYWNILLKVFTPARILFCFPPTPPSPNDFSNGLSLMQSVSRRLYLTRWFVCYSGGGRWRRTTAITLTPVPRKPSKKSLRIKWFNICWNTPKNWNKLFRISAWITSIVPW